MVVVGWVWVEVVVGVDYLFVVIGDYVGGREEGVVVVDYCLVLF